MPAEPALVIVQLLGEISVGLVFPECLASLAFFTSAIPLPLVDVTSRAVVYPVKSSVRDESGKQRNLASFSGMS